MPCWTRDEIDSILSYFPNLDRKTVASHFDKYGGIPRYVLTETDKWNESLEYAISATRMEELQKSVGGPELLPAVSHKVLHYDVDSSSEYRRCTVRFASDYIDNRITNKLLSGPDNKTLELLRDLAGMRSLASVRGSLFEQYAHKVLQGKGTWKLRALTSDKQTQLTMSNDQLVVFHSLDELIVSEGVYYQPKSKNFGALDSIARLGNDVYLFQITVSDVHLLSHAKLQQHLVTLTSNNPNCKFTLVFVTPSDISKKFGKQGYLNTEGKVIEDKDLAQSLQSVEQWVMVTP